MNFKLGIDLGGTTAKIGLVDGDKKILKERSVRTSGFPNPRHLIGELAAVSNEMAQGFKVRSVGVGIAGDIDFEKGIVRVSPNLKWKNVPFKRQLERKVSFPVKVDNDANAAAWGVYKTQTPKNVKHILVLTLGTGIGGGIVIDGKIHRGATGSAGEFGHLTIFPNGLACNCGDRGCLEAYAGGVCLARNVSKAIKGGVRTKLHKIYFENPRALSPLDIFKAAQSGDKFANLVWNDVGHVLGMAIANLVYLFNPEMVFLTGGIALAGDLLLKPLKEKMYERAFFTPIHAAKIRIAKNAPQMGMIGAALL